MAAKTIEWSRRALGDIHRLHDFLYAKNPDAADRAVRTIEAAVQNLIDFPDAGRLAEEEDPRLRAWLVPFANGGYVVTYLYNGETVRILDIRHQREAGY